MAASNIDVNTTTGNFKISLPQKMLMGFAEANARIMMNVKTQLFLFPTSTKVNAFVVTTAGGTAAAANETFDFTNVCWKLSYEHMVIAYRIPLPRQTGKEQPLTMAIRSWAIIQIPGPILITQQTWMVKTTSQHSVTSCWSSRRIERKTL